MTRSCYYGGSDRVYFDSIQKLESQYPEYRKRPIDKRIKSDELAVTDSRYSPINIYYRVGSTTEDHSNDNSWKAARIAVAILTAALGILIVPLFFKGFYKSVVTLWNEGQTGIQKVALYVFQKQVIAPVEDDPDWMYAKEDNYPFDNDNSPDWMYPPD